MQPQRVVKLLQAARLFLICQMGTSAAIAAFWLLYDSVRSWTAPSTAKQPSNYFIFTTLRDAQRELTFFFFSFFFFGIGNGGPEPKRSQIQTPGIKLGWGERELQGGWLVTPGD